MADNESGWLEMARLLDENDPRLYIKKAREFARISPEQEIELAKRIEQKDDSAAEQFINANLFLVVSQAKKYSKRTGIPLVDLIQDGNLGLIRAVNKFNWRMGRRFSTYAYRWIKQSILRAGENYFRTINLSSEAYTSLTKIKNKIEELTQVLGRPPELIELSQHLGFSIDKIQKLLSRNDRLASLDDQVIYGSEAVPLGDLIEDYQTVSPPEYACTRDEYKQIMRHFACLNPREQIILEMRFGLNDHNEHTLEEIAKEFNVTRQRIRQVVICAIQKLQISLKAQANGLGP